MFELIKLHGKMTGSVRLWSEHGNTRFEIKQRNAKAFADQAFEVYLLSAHAVSKAEFDGIEGSAQINSPKGIIILNENGELVSEGTNSLDSAAMNRARTEIRLRTSKEKIKQPVKNEPGTISEAARSILEQAKILFRGDITQPVVPSEKPRIKPDRTAIKNPFPNAFSASSWYVENETGCITGRVRINGRVRTLKAYPEEKTNGPCRRRCRRLKSRDGKLYRIEFDP